MEAAWSSRDVGGGGRRAPEREGAGSPPSDSGMAPQPIEKARSGLGNAKRLGLLG